MIKFFKNYKRNQGMTYVELIVVLSIFASLSTVVMFNYNEFQERIDIKNLSSDIALKVVEAQKSSISGRLPPSQPVGGQNWKPSYGVYLNPATDNEFFYYFTDIVLIHFLILPQYVWMKMNPWSRSSCLKGI